MRHQGQILTYVKRASSPIRGFTGQLASADKTQHESPYRRQDSGVADRQRWLWMIALAVSLKQPAVEAQEGYATGPSPQAMKSGSLDVRGRCGLTGLQRESTL